MPRSWPTVTATCTWPARPTEDLQIGITAKGKVASRPPDAELQMPSAATGSSGSAGPPVPGNGIPDEEVMRSRTWARWRNPQREASSSDSRDADLTWDEEQCKEFGWKWDAERKTWLKWIGCPGCMSSHWCSHWSAAKKGWGWKA